MKRIIRLLTGIISAVVIPLLLTASLLYVLVTNTGFYINIIKDMDPVKTIIEAKNTEAEKKFLTKLKKEQD